MQACGAGDRPGFRDFFLCAVDGPRAAFLFFTLHLEPQTRVALAALLSEEPRFLAYNRASLHSCGLLPKVMIKLAWQGLHLELGVSWAGSYSSESDPRWGRLETLLAKASLGATAHFQPIEPGDAWSPPLKLLFFLVEKASGLTLQAIKSSIPQPHDLVGDSSMGKSAPTRLSLKGN